MGTTSEELKKLYAKLGGKDPKVAGFSAPGEILNAINEIPLPTEYELPTVTTEDAGDVLVVNEEGHWDKGESGAGVTPNPEGEATVDLTKLGVGDTVYGIPDNAIFYSIYQQSTYYYLSDNTKKIVDLISDVQNGKAVYLINSSGILFSLTSCDNSRIRFATTGVSVANGMYYFDYWSLISEDVLGNKFTGSRRSFYQIPEVASSDNGKVMTVVNGVWDKKAPGTETVIIDCTVSGGIGNTFSLILPSGMNFGELDELLYAGKDVILKDPSSGAYYRLQKYIHSSNVYFTCTFINTNGKIQCSGVTADLITASGTTLSGVYNTFAPEA